MANAWYTEQKGRSDRQLGTPGRAPVYGVVAKGRRNSWDPLLGAWERVPVFHILLSAVVRRLVIPER